MANNPVDPEENLPDWLRALRNKQSAKSAPQEPTEASPGDESVPEEEPDWLAEIRRRHQGETAHENEERALTDTQPNPPARLEKRRIQPDPVDEPEETDEAASGLPDWLQDEPEPTDAELGEIIDEETSDMPMSTPAFSGGDIEPIAPGELPSWLQAIRPGSTPFPDEDAHSDEMLPSYEIENAGPLAGLSGVLPAEPEIAKIAKAPVFSSRLEVTESQYRHAAALRDLLDAEAQPRQDYATAVARPARILNAIMAGALLVAAVLPLFTGAQGAPRPELNAYPEAAEIFNAIDVLPADAPVLLAFDVEPALYGEMQPAITAVMAHLLEKQARLVFISTQPSGPGLVERLLQEQFADSPAIISGDYVDLGYLSGGMAALRSFSSDPRAATLSAITAITDPWDASALQAVDQLADFALVLVAASDGDDGRAWIEQTTSEYTDGLLVITSAQGAPTLRTYLTSNPVTVRGLVAGLSGAAFYERLRASDGLGRAYWDSYSYGLGAAVLLILLGGLYGRFIQTQPEKVRVKS